MTFQDKAQKEYGYSGVPKAAVMANLLKLNVYFNSLNLRKVKEDIKYDLITMVYAFGGAISLYLGISLAMVFEVFEFLINTIVSLFYFCSGRSKILP